MSHGHEPPQTIAGERVVRLEPDDSSLSMRLLRRLVRRCQLSAVVVAKACLLQEHVERVHTEHEHAAFTRASKDHNLVAFLDLHRLTGICRNDDLSLRANGCRAEEAGLLCHVYSASLSYLELYV